MSKVRDIRKFVTDNIPSRKLDENSNTKLGIEMMKGSAKARELLIKNNMILVKNLVDAFCKDDNQYEDMLQSGYIGLICAVDGYNYNLGLFIPYASKWINKYIRLSLYEISNLIEMPEEMSRIAMMINAIKNDMYSKLGRTPTYDEISEHKDVIKLMNQNKLNKKSLKVLLKLNGYDSLEQYVSNQTDTRYIDILEDQQATVDKSIISENLVSEILRTLPDRDANVVTMYLGLCGHPKLSFQEIGDKLDLTKQRCSGIYSESIEKLKKRFEGYGTHNFWEML